MWGGGSIDLELLVFRACRVKQSSAVLLLRRAGASPHLRLGFRDWGFAFTLKTLNPELPLALNQTHIQKRQKLTRGTQSPELIPGVLGFRV